MTTEERCIQALHDAAKQLGESPTKAQYEELGLTPASATIIRAFGGWNDAKEVAGLSTNPSRGPRTQPKTDDVVGPPGTSWEELTVDQRWHYRNVERNAERTLQRRAALRAWVHKYKERSEGCSRCEEDDPACLDFHHVNPDEKTKNVSALITYEPSLDRLVEEIEKCELLCANCHRKEHYEVQDGALTSSQD